MNQPLQKRPTPAQRHDYHWFSTVQTRWSDNDLYGHVNNVTYYAYFDSAINRFLIEQGGLDIHNGDQIGFIVESTCHYFQPVAYPQALECGFKVTRLGSSSVDYELAIFTMEDSMSVATGKMTHVFVDRDTQKPKAIAGKLLAALNSQFAQRE